MAFLRITPWTLKVSDVYSSGLVGNTLSLMAKPGLTIIQDVELPFSKGLLSAKMWRSEKALGKVVVGVPELGLHCYGDSQQEAGFRLFSALLKYYGQLKENKDKLTEKGIKHLELLSTWVQSIESRLTERSGAGQVVALRR